MTICTTIEKPGGDVSTIVSRPDVIHVHARGAADQGRGILNWKAVFDTVAVPTHEITVRVPPDVKIDLNHWVYHADRFSETWYKVQTVEDLGGARRFLVLDVYRRYRQRQAQRSRDAAIAAGMGTA